MKDVEIFTQGGRTLVRAVTKKGKAAMSKFINQEKDGPHVYGFNPSLGDDVDEMYRYTTEDLKLTAKIVDS